MLFLVLVYVYPLKFLMKFLVSLYGSLITGDWEYFQVAFASQMQKGDMRFLMMVYGLGAAFIFFTLTMLYRHAYRKRKELELDDYETFQTKTSVRTNLLMGAIPLLSFVIAFFGFDSMWTYSISGFTYMLYPVIMPIHGWRVGREQKKLFG